MKSIIKPFMTEKTLLLAAKGWYTFVVALQAEKKQIASDIAKFYNVTVTEVRTVHMHGKTRRVGKKMQHADKSDWKKAMVHLSAGQKIDAFEVTTQEVEKSGSASGGK
jgi:large subunit ribosomal protein L23